MMIHDFLRFFMAVLFVFLFSCSPRQTDAIVQKPAMETEVNETVHDLSDENPLQNTIITDDAIPVDDRLTSGVLSNGVKYYIQANTKPENRAELRLKKMT